MLSDLCLGRLARTLGAFTGVFFLGAAAHAAEPADETKPPHHLDRGLDLRAGISVVPAWVTLRYQGPTDPVDDPELPSNESGQLDVSTNAFAVAGETSFGIGYLDGRGNRYGVDAAGLFGGIAAGGTSLPHASLTMIAMASIGPSYTRFFSPRLEMDLSARGAVLAFAGGRQDILAYDNVIEFPAHFGFLGSIGTAYRLSAKGPVALTCALQGGLQFAGPQTASLLGVSLGVKFD